MYQFGTAYPVSVSRPVKLIPGTICFTVLITAHILVLSIIDFSRSKPRQYNKETSVTLDISESVMEDISEITSTAAEEEPAVVTQTSAVLPVETLPASLPPETPVVEPVPAAVLPETPAPAVPESIIASKPPSSDSDATPRRVTVSKNVVPVKTGAVEKSNQPGMSDAEYITLIMGRLEKYKIYPLSLRKRGIQGDAGVIFTIRSDGTTADITTADTGTHRLLVQAAIQTVKAAEPFPVRKGSNTDYVMQVTIRYRLEE
jgi:TonB family protein